MVTTTEATEIVTEPKTTQLVQPSFKRWLKHVCYLPATKRFFSQEDQHAIAIAVEQAEHGHVGEIQVVIEACLPANLAYSHNTLSRARQLFAELGTWDTEFNSGILVYLNLCERKVELVIDRGIKQATTQAVWDEICEKIIKCLMNQEYRKSLVVGVEQVGQLLDTYYDRKIVDKADEISNKPIILG
jgi:uncharacterized membrane protein